MEIFTKAKTWLTARMPERTSHDGVLLVAVCGSVLLFGGVATLLAWVGLAWGVYTLVRGEA
jgi:hypothetical protein